MRRLTAALCAAFCFLLIACDQRFNSPTGPPDCIYDRCTDRYVCPPVRLESKCKNDPQ